MYLKKVWGVLKKASIWYILSFIFKPYSERLSHADIDTRIKNNENVNNVYLENKKL